MEYTNENGDLYYLNNIDNMINEELRSLYVDLQHLESFDPIVVDEILSMPSLGLKAATDSLKQVLLGKEPEFLSRMQNRIYLRFTNPPDRIKKTLRRIRSYALGTLIATQAIITKSTEVKPYLETATFRCVRCQSLQPSIKFTDGEYNPPFACINATNQNEPCVNKTFTLMKDQSTFIDFQRVSLQERPEELPSGQMPESLSMFMRDDLCDLIRPGDRVKILGIMESRTDGPITRGKMPLFMKYVECVSLERESEEYTDITINDDDEREIIELSKDPNIHRKIRNSIAPVIYGALEEKEGISYLLFGGSTKVASDGTKIRGESNILLIGDPGMGKCVHPDTEILLASGERLAIGKYIDNYITNKNHIPDGYFEYIETEILSINFQGKIIKQKSDIIWKRKSPNYLLKIRTLSGRTITVTETHPFFTCKDALIFSIKAKDLKIDDLIAVPRKIVIDGENSLKFDYIKSKANNAVKLIPPSEIYPWFAKFLGLLLAEGYSNVNQILSTHITFINSDIGPLNDFKDALNNLGVKYNTRHIKNKVFEIYCEASELYLYLEAIDLCLVSKSAGKRIPNIIMKSTNIIVSDFLKSFFDGDAHVRKVSPSIEVDSVSINFLSDLQILLLRFEILSQIKEKSHKDKIYHKLRITGKSDLIKFATNINFTISSKKSQLLCHVSSNKLVNVNLDTIPNVNELILSLKSNTQLSQREFGLPSSTFMHYERGDRNSSRQELQQICKNFKNKISDKKNLKKLNNLRSIANADIYWDKIVKIESIKSDTEWVYDLQVPEFHNFIANNIVIHNSQILKSVSDLVPRGIYTSGRGSSAAGLTAAVIRDPETGEMTLEAGAVVLADKGIAFIDEFDKMRKEDRSALHEAMEQHTVSIAKAGIVATLNARTSILAAANPKLGRWDMKKDTLDNLNLPPTIISRFDLIFPLIDTPKRSDDEAKASHILQIHSPDQELEQVDEGLSKDLFRKYIAYARKKIQPQLSTEAKDEILKFYLDLREGKGLGNDIETQEFNLEDDNTIQPVKIMKTIAITPRQLESLIRLSEARAKIALRTEVSREDAIRVIELFKKTLNRVTKGDIDSLYGMSTQTRNKREIILNIIESLSQGDQSPDIDDILRRGKELGLDDSDIRDMVDQLLQNGDIYEPRPGQFKRMD